MMPTPTRRLPWFSPALALLAAMALSGCVHDSLATGSVSASRASSQPVPYAGNPNPADRKASAECWMHYEHGRADLPLDVRANLVDKCIAEKEAKAGH